ncbi:MAG: hypothetical protein EBX49_12450, partial [Synechococcaceae bacterium WB8_1B_136]|nr:hypothetical protein [Synechococcaceae bacterium WB8_1B_136]
MSGNDGSILADLRTEASRLGFSRLGVAPADPARRPPFVHEGFKRWLDAGFAGTMEPWLREHEPLRRDVRQLLADASSVIMLATDHASESPEDRGGPGPFRGCTRREPGAVPTSSPLMNALES